MKRTELETRLVESLADEAVLKFDRDADAIRYFDKELHSRYPGIWLAITNQEIANPFLERL